MRTRRVAVRARPTGCLLLLRRLVAELFQIDSVQIKDPRMQHWALLEGRANGSMETVLEVQIALPLDNMREQIAEESGIL
jgi:hypothetical protein